MEPYIVNYFEVYVLQLAELVPIIKIPPRKKEYTQNEISETLRGLQNKCTGGGLLLTDTSAAIIPHNAVVVIEAIFDKP